MLRDRSPDRAVIRPRSRRSRRGGGASSARANSQGSFRLDRYADHGEELIGIGSRGKDPLVVSGSIGSRRRPSFRRVEPAHP